MNSFQNTRKKDNKIEVRNMKRFNKEHFNADLLAQRWEQIVLKPDTNSMWTLWKDLFMEALDKHAPVQQIRKRSSKEIKKLISDRDKLKRRAMLTKYIDWDHYKMSRNKVNVALRRAKSTYYCSKIASQNNNPKRARLQNHQ